MADINFATGGPSPYLPPNVKEGNSKPNPYPKDTVFPEDSPTPPPTPPPQPGGPTRYNTTPSWRDPFTAPSFNDPYWAEWFAANPTYQIPRNDNGTPKGGWPGGPASPSNRPTTASDQAGLAAYIRQYGQTHPGVNPSVINDPTYWAGRMLATHGQNPIDWGYWEGPQGMYRPEGAPEGGGSPTGPTTGTTPPPRAPFQPLGSGLTGSYQQAIQVIKDRYQQYYGHPLSDAALQTILQKYNLSETTAATGPTQGSLLTSARLDPSQTGTAQQALDYLNAQSQRIRGSALSQDEIQQAASLIGYSGGQVTGAQVNQILGELDKRATIRGADTPGAPGTARTFTANDINPILQALYDNTSTGWDKGGPGPGGGGPGPNGNPGGYTDPSSVLYLNQLMQRLAQLNSGQNDPWENILKLFSLSRAGDLFNSQPYTGGEDAALTAQYMNPLTQARDAELQRNRERIGQRGMLPSSGLLDVLDKGTNQGYERAVGAASNNLGVQAVNEKQRRADQALQILSNLLTVNRTGVDRQNALADEAVNVAKMFPDFDLARFNMLLNAGGEGPSTNGTLGSIGDLGKLGLTGTLNSQNNSANNATLWGQILGYILNNVSH